MLIRIWSAAILGVVWAASVAYAADSSMTTATAEEMRLDHQRHLAPEYVRILLRYPGVYRVRGKDLSAAGLNLEKVPAARLSLWNEGRMVPLHVSTTNKHLGADDYLEFVGQSPHGTYSTYKPYNLHNVYFLHWKERAPLRYKVECIQESDKVLRDATFMDNRLWEDDRIFRRIPIPPGRTDGFFARLFTAGTTVPLRLDLPGFDARPGKPLEMDFRFFGVSFAGSAKPQHRFDLYYGGDAIGEIAFDGMVYFDCNTSVPASKVRANTNVEIVTPEDRLNTVDMAALDNVRFRYPRKLDAESMYLFTFNSNLVGHQGTAEAVVRGLRPRSRVFAVDQAVLYEPAAAKPDVVVRLGDTATTCVAVSEDGLYMPDLMTAKPAPNIADVPKKTRTLVLYHPDVAKSASYYTRYRQQQGIETLAVNVQDIYDMLSRGYASDDVLKRYIRYVAQEAPSLRYLVLFGDSTYDYREVDYLEVEGLATGNTYKVLIPIHWIYNPATTYTSGYPDDNWYGAFSAANAPDIGVGRIPANTDEEGYEYCRKVIEYEQLKLSRNDKALMISSVESSFQDLVNQTCTALADKFSTITVLFPETSVATREVRRLHDEITSGVQLVYYVGHGGSFVWRVGPVDFKQQKDLFTPAEVATLTNEGRYPIITCSSCYTTSFDNELSLGEAFVLRPRGGCIAMIGTPWKSTVYEDHQFNRKFLDAYVDAKTERLGDAFFAAKKALRPQRDDMVDFQTFTLLGDPCLRLVRNP